MKPLEFHCRLVLNIQLLQTLRAARVPVPGLPVRMQHGYAAAVRPLEFVQTAIGAHPELPIQLEKIDLVGHAFSPVAWWRSCTPGRSGGREGTPLASRRASIFASIFLA
jgi:hypothetical protein